MLRDARLSEALGHGYVKTFRQEKNIGVLHPGSARVPLNEIQIASPAMVAATRSGVGATVQKWRLEGSLNRY